jgi:cytochrome c553
MHAVTRRAAIAIALAAGGPTGALAGDALAGKRLYHDTERARGTAASCVDCHGGLPGGLYGIGKAAGNAAAVDYAINAIPQMSPLRGRLTAQDLEDLAAYLEQPAVPSPDLRFSATTPVSRASADRLDFPPVAAGVASPPGSVWLLNVGRIGVSLHSDPVLEGPDAALFEIVAGDCRAGTWFGPGQRCRVEVVFKPHGPPGLRSASLGIRHDWLRGATHIALIGRIAESENPRKPRLQMRPKTGS